MADATLDTAIEDGFNRLEATLERFDPGPRVREVGTVKYMGSAVARVTGLAGVKSDELLRFPGGVYGLAFNLDPSEVGVIMLAESGGAGSGATVRRTGRVVSVPVGGELLGRMVDPLGRPIDGGGPVRSIRTRPIEREAPAIMDRLPVTVPLQTGIKVIDALIPIGRGQRELILGDRQTGKTSIALDAIINQADKDVVCIYCAVGQRSSSVAKIMEDLRNRHGLGHTIVVAAAGEDPPGMKFIAPYAAATMGEFFMEQGRDVLVVYDDFTQHARAYRELSLLLRSPPGREAYPGDIFYIHSRLLERFTHLSDELGGGSMTAMPIIETEAQNVSAYIPTNLISITDGQVYLSPDLFSAGILPAVDAGRSVSRVGGKTQLPAYRAVAGDLRLSYSRFVELEKFARFSTRLDEKTRKTLDRGRRVREVLKQDQYRPMPVTEQVAVLLAATSGLFDRLEPEDVAPASEEIRSAVAGAESLAGVRAGILAGEKLSGDDREAILDVARKAVEGRGGGGSLWRR